MTVNRYFDHLTNTVEQDFFQDLVVESIQVSGMDVDYIIRENGIDPILREEFASEFNNTFKIEAYFHDVERFGGEGDLMTKFGWKQTDTMQISIAKKRWRDLKVPGPGRLERPREGDLIFLPMSKTLFEITYVENEDPFWQIGRYHAYKLTCAMFTQGYETFNTGKPIIDSTGTADNTHEIDASINNAISSASDLLMDFEEKNPFSGL